ncbi:MAG: hypothetical protein KH135_04510 [Firmicutes bacterium]|nr:hypothetical protein [Bacillota bacterium]
MTTGKKIKTKEAELKRQKKFNENREKEQQAKQELAKKVQEETKEMLLPSIRNKMNEVAEVIREKVSKNNGLTISQILPLITKRSTADIATIQNKTYTSYELGEALNIYMEMIAQINTICKFPPSKGSFCALLGISRKTYDNYMCDPEKIDIMGIIDDYITTSVLTSAQLGELREISSMFTLKTQHGFVEASTPVVIEHKKTTDIDEINKQLEALKGQNIIEAEFEEKDENS